MPENTLNVQTPLNLVLPILPGRTPQLLADLNELNTRPVNPLQQALVALGNVHFAQFVLLKGGTRLGVFTIFDGAFDDYIQSFTEHIGDVFNAVLKHVADGADQIVPVQQNRDAFLQFIKAHDAKGFGLFSAYPNRRLFDIKDALAGVSK